MTQKCKSVCRLYGLTFTEFVSERRLCFSHFVLLFSLASTEIPAEREVWAYTTISLIADLGGALSLFVGVSALSVWDCFEYILQRYKQFKI